MRAPSRRSLVKLLVLVALVGAAVYFRYFTEAGARMTFRAVHGYLAGFPPAVLPLLYILVYVVGTVLLLPGTLLSFVGALLFGLFEATLYTWVGATAGATLAFFAARLLGRGFVNDLLAGRLEALDRKLTAHGFTGLLVLRLVPLFPFNGINFGAGLTGIRPRDYVLATAVGILPGVFVYQFLFDQLGERLLTEGFAWSDLRDVRVLLALGLFAGFIAAGRWLGRRLARDDQPPP